ncbi:trehalose-phosphatase [Ilumatobacter nonamiensis]|uniref:trehalose-phosphatase n=1 Tax=Ilumatobacter nonamiensis TaxID=467093 RepID=UPI000683DC63|nr:trehalose-phosphatase [Ilumatobacter nonamiensis]
MTDSTPAPSMPDEPVELARLVAALERPLLLALDCDGVLAPLTDHADDSILTSGLGPDLARLADVDGVTVAILSGRSLDGLAQFEFDAAIQVWGSYGAEQRGVAQPELTAEESERLDVLDELVSEAARRAGTGAWVERKPTSVVVHVREADRDLSDAALDWARTEQGRLVGHAVHEGSNVLELMTRPADKGTGLDALRKEIDPASSVYVGDDVPDEDAFARLGPGDVAIKIGPGDTLAGHRLADPDAMRSMIRALVDSLDPPTT